MMRVNEIIVEGPVWDKLKNTVSSTTSSAGKFYNRMSDPRSKGLKSGQKDIDKWAKQVLQQWGTIEAGLENSNLGPLTVKNNATNPNQNNVEDNQQQYATQFSKWMRNYFGLSVDELPDYTVSTDGEFNNENILKYIKKTYALKLSPEYVEKQNAAVRSSIPTDVKKLIPGKTQIDFNNSKYLLSWIGPNGEIVGANDQLNAQLNNQSGI